MATGRLSGVIQHLRRAMLLRDGAGLTDQQLLDDYISRRDKAALAALVQRHGPMVWGVCRRVLTNYHDAEDAFQATFLVLVRRAASIASPELLANWLYGVAHQTAIKARATVAKRKMRERQVTEMPEQAGVEQGLWNDLQPLLDQELSRLPDKYRGVIVLCDLEGKTREEVAGQLGCAEGTVASRLARARIMLAKRLTQRGVTLSGGALAVVLAQQVASAGVPNSVVDSTIKAASLLAAGKAVATGVISLKVAALTEGVMKAMLFTKLRAAIAVVLVLGFVATGATILTCRTAAGQDEKKPTAEKPVEPAAKQEKEKEGFTAWGKEINGLQAGVGFPAGQKRSYSHGETVTLVVRVRNVGKEEVTFQSVPAFFKENPATVTDAEGKPVPLRGISPGGRTHPSTDVTLAPGKEVELYEWKAALQPASEIKNPNFEIIYGTGKFSIQYERVLGNSSASRIKIDPALSKLATGKLELEVKDAGKLPEKQQEKEAFTAWGKEINGLQAGLGFRPGEKRPYTHGETVNLVVRVRNVSKEDVKFQYLKEFFMETPPLVTGGDGKTIRLGGVDLLGSIVHIPVDVNLAPGKEMELHDLKLKLGPASEGGDVTEVSPDALHGKGTFQIQYERVFGNSSAAGQIKLDPNLSKLATGKLELEIKAGPPAAPAATEKKP